MRKPTWKGPAKRRPSPHKKGPAHQAFPDVGEAEVAETVERAAKQDPKVAEAGGFKKARPSASFTTPPGVDADAIDPAQQAKRAKERANAERYKPKAKPYGWKNAKASEPEPKPTASATTDYTNAQAAKADAEEPPKDDLFRPGTPGVADVPTNDTTALNGGDAYYIRIDTVTRSIVEIALRLAHYGDGDDPFPAVKIVDAKTGKTVRTLDGRIDRPEMRRRSSAPRAPGGSSGPKLVPTDPAAKKKLVETLLKKELTSPEVRAITKWPDPKMSMRNAVTAIAIEQKLEVEIVETSRDGKHMLAFKYSRKP